MDAVTREPLLAPPIRRARRWMLGLLCVLVTAGLGAGIWLWPVAPPADKSGRDLNPVIPVVATEAVTRDMPVWLDGLGTVQAFQTVTVKTMVDGPLVSVAFKEGQHVRVGDVLARIDPRVYQAALDSAVAKKALDEATLANARLDLARYQKLVVTNYATQQQADTAKATVAQTEALVRQDQAQIDTAQAQLSYTTIASPLDGIVGIRQVDAGNIVHAADQTGLVVITQLQPISVVFSLPQQSLARVAAAQLGTDGPEVVAYSQGTRRRTRQAAGSGLADGAGQSDRPHHGDDQTQGDVSEQGGHAVARRIRRRPPASGYRGQRDGGAAGRRATWASPELCLRRRSGQCRPPCQRYRRL